MQENSGSTNELLRVGKIKNTNRNPKMLVLALAFSVRLITLKHNREVVGRKFEPNSEKDNCLNLLAERNSESKDILHGVEGIEISLQIQKQLFSRLFWAVELFRLVENAHLSGRIIERSDNSKDFQNRCFKRKEKISRRVVNLLTMYMRRNLEIEIRFWG